MRQVSRHHEREQAHLRRKLGPQPVPHPQKVQRNLLPKRRRNPSRWWLHTRFPTTMFWQVQSKNYIGLETNTGSISTGGINSLSKGALENTTLACALTNIWRRCRRERILNSTTIIGTLSTSHLRWLSKWVTSSKNLTVKNLISQWHPWERIQSK